jgi:1,2-diacylglycerol 3-alpha-glucosyltransferase
VNSEQELAAVLAEISSGAADLRAMAAESEKRAKEMLDYAVLARRILF